MSAMILIPVSLIMGLVGLGAFFWALRHGQFEDPAGNSSRILIPDPDPGQDRAAPAPAADKQNGPV